MCYRWLFPSIAVFLLLIPTTQAALFDWPDWLNPPPPGNGTFNDNIRCYSLPFGVLGFVSHLISYWNVFWLLKYQRPLWPFEEVGHKEIDFVTLFLSLCGTVIPSIITSLGCHSDWRFILIAIWKLFFSICVSIIGLHTVREADKPPAHRKSFSSSKSWAPSLYTIGVLVGLTGLISVVKEDWNPVTKPMVVICCVFWGVAALLVSMILPFLLCGGKDHDRWAWRFIKFIFLIIVFFTAIWSDWILAAISVKHGGTWHGIPHEYENRIIFGVFIGSRILPVFLI